MQDVSPKTNRLRLSLNCTFESLESRRLLSVSPAVVTAANAVVDSGFTTFSANPSVNTVDPVNGATGVPRDKFISCDLNLLPNAGTSEVDPDTLAGNVTLTKTSDNANVIGTVKTSGGGDSIVFTPSGLLVANASYTFKVTSGVKDMGGNSFTPFTSTFTTGTGSSSVPSNIRFDQVPLPNATGHNYTSMAIGPDGDLYIGDDMGYIYRYVINPDGTLGASKTIKVVRANNVIAGSTLTDHGARIIAGMAFDPNSSAKHPVLWITSGYPAVSGSPNWSGKVSRLSGTNLNVYQDEVVNLPRSFKDHLTEGISFGPDGAIYISQASNSAMGAPDTTWNNEPEELLNAAILRLDPSKLSSVPLDAKTRQGGTYDPTASGAPLTLYATGIRNAYEPVWTDDGHLFAATNGSSSGGNSPAGGGVPAEMNLPTQPDYLYDVKEGGYYGHPNPLRNQFVENGGNPTSGVDPGEVVAYPVGTQPDSDYKGFVYNFGSHESPDGAIEYKGNAFGGLLNGDLLITQYAGGSNIIDLSRSGGSITETQQSIAGFTGFDEPLPLVEDQATGNIYVGEYGGQSVMLLRVDEKALATTPEVATTETQLLFNTAKGVNSDPLFDTLLNDGLQELDISSLSISGTNAADFKISTKPTLPAALLPGQSTSVGITFIPGSGESTGLKTASLTVHSNDPGHPTFNVQLRGLVTAGGTDEPSLQRVFDLYQVPDTVGDDDASTSSLPIPPQKPNDEIKAQLFTRADASTPIEIDMLGAFGDNADPYAVVGSYSSADGTQAALFDIDSGSNRTVNPQIDGPTTFFAGAKPFGLYVETDQNGHTTFSQDSLNTYNNGKATAGHLVRVYPMKNADGSTVANAYVVAFEVDGNTTVDNQDVIFEIKNVKPSALISAGPPSPPTNLQVTNSVNVVTMTWTASPEDDVTGYIIKRSTNSKTNFITLTDTQVSATTYTDRTPGKKKYYYRVFAEDSQGRLSDPAKVSTTVTAGVGSSKGSGESTQALTSADIGSPTPAGSTSVITDGSDYDLVAGGADVQGTSDQFRFAYQQVTGDFDVKVQVANVTAADMWSKAGIMARSTLLANSANVYMLASPTKYRMTFRPIKAVGTQAVGDGVPSYPNTWMRLTRVGNFFTGYASTDGVNWTMFASETLSLSKTLFLGLAATGHNTSATTTAEFRNYATV